MNQKPKETVLDDDIRVTKYRSGYRVDHGTFPLHIVYTQVISDDYMTV